MPVNGPKDIWRYTYSRITNTDSGGEMRQVSRYTLIFYTPYFRGEANSKTKYVTSIAGK
jgi:hypothetical protein